MAFGFERNLVINQTGFDFTGFGGLFLNNTWKNTSLSARTTNSARDTRILGNKFDTNGTTNAVCLDFNSGSSSNLTIANNTILECGILISGAGGNSTLRDNNITTTISAPSRSSVILISSTSDILLQNTTITSNTGNEYDIWLSLTRNITIANSTIRTTVETQLTGVIVDVSNSTLISENDINNFGDNILVGGISASPNKVHLDTKIIRNRLNQRGVGSANACITLRPSGETVNRTDIRGNIFNCTIAIQHTDAVYNPLSDLNITDNTIINGTIIFYGNYQPITRVRITNNSISGEDSEPFQSS